MGFNLRVTGSKSKQSSLKTKGSLQTGPLFGHGRVISVYQTLLFGEYIVEN